MVARPESAVFPHLFRIVDTERMDERDRKEQRTVDPPSEKATALLAGDSRRHYSERRKYTDREKYSE